MNACPAGWGFRDATALANIDNSASVMQRRTDRAAKCRTIRESDLAAYIATLRGKVPSPDAIIAHFGCERSTAYRRRVQIIARLAEHGEAA